MKRPGGVREEVSSANPLNSSSSPASINSISTIISHPKVISRKTAIYFDLLLVLLRLYIHSFFIIMMMMIIIIIIIVSQADQFRLLPRNESHIFHLLFIAILGVYNLILIFFVQRRRNCVGCGPNCVDESAPATPSNNQSSANTFPGRAPSDIHIRIYCGPVQQHILSVMKMYSGPEF